MNPLVKTILITTASATLALANYATTTKVIDGDTVYFKSQSKEVKCRMAYIDTPEKSNNKKAKKDLKQCSHITPAHMKEAGLKATQYAKHYFQIGSKHKINIIDTDRYGRAVCEVGEFNKRIVEEGYAIPFKEYIPKQKQREYSIALKQAKQNTQGLWQTHREVMECLGK
jgi:endonuclease YncB( thermonuclease family)